MKLHDLIAEVRLAPLRIAGDGEVAAVTIDSRRVEPGALFVCMPGMTRDSRGFLSDAAARGATAALVYDAAGFEAAREQGLAAVQVGVEGTGFEDFVWRLCDQFFVHPTREMKVIGLTGTNGKTTTASLLRDMLATLGFRAAYLGTLGFEMPGLTCELPNTTPFAVELYNLLSRARDRGVDALAMEVSSHALVQRRVDGVEFDAAIFTNLTQDHLDFHGTMDAYAEAKRRLFDELPQQTSKPFVAVLNIDDPVGREWSKELTAPVVTFSTRRPADVWLRDPEVKIDRISFDLHLHGYQSVPISVPLGGHYNVENLLAACAGVRALGFSAADVAKGTAGVRPVRGRFEPVPNDVGIHVLVDYAHTPDALAKLLGAVRQLTNGRVITVFGCGGDRDRTKRPLMARQASAASDLTIATSDNPRTEDPVEILRQVAAGMSPGREYRMIVDRREAIFEAVQLALPGDTVVIAGKGHETYQIVGRDKFPFDDRIVASEALGRRKTELGEPG